MSGVELTVFPTLPVAYLRMNLNIIEDPNRYPPIIDIECIMFRYI